MATEATTNPRARIAFVTDDSQNAREAFDDLVRRYGNVPLEQAGVIVAIGGDGLMLKTLHAQMERNLPIFGLNRGSVGFLMNEYRENDLLDRVIRAEEVELRPLRMLARNRAGDLREALAVNEVSLLRETSQTAKLRITIDDVVRMEELMCDGILVATPAGSTAYNFSAHGPILPLKSNVLALTPISAFRPRRWRGAVLPHEAKVRFDILDPDKRPVSAVADSSEVRNVVRVDVEEAEDVSLRLLFDPEHNLEERILKEQFIP